MELKGQSRRRAVGLAVLAAIYFAIQWLLPRPAGVEPQSWRLLGIFAATIAGLILQPLPGGALVLIAITLAALFGGLSAAQALSGYAEPTVWLVMAALFISDALIKTGLARRIALLFVRAVGSTSLGICYALAATDMALAGIIPSNAARSGGVVLPVARSIAELYGSKPGETAGVLGGFLVAGIYQSICITTAMFYTGQASNPLVARMATETFHVPVTMLSWFRACIVPGLCSLAVVPLLVYRMHPPKIRRTPEASSFAASELRGMGPMKRGELTVLGVFAGVCGLWATTPLHGLDISITALAGAAALLAFGVLKWEDVAGNRAAWDIFIWYGGLVRLGKALNDAGLTQEFAKLVSGLLGGGGWVVLLGCALAIYFYAHYGYASITSHIMAMYVPFTAVMIAKGAPPGLAVFAFACATNLAAGLTHYGTTPAPMFYSVGYVSFRNWWSIGFAASLVNLAIWCTVGFGWWKLIGIW
ncbi:MAG: DASS family sodium-coupled anion symporter [Bryobacteraceae bacterium]